MRNLFLIVIICIHQITFAQSWYKLFGEEGFDRGYDIVEMPDSGFLVTGVSGSFSNGHSDAFLLRTDKYGNYLWSRPLGGGENDGAFAMKRIDNFGVYVMGRTTASTGDFDSWVTLVNDLGDEIWSRSYAGENWEEIVDAAVTSDSGLIVGVNMLGPITESSDVMLMRLNADGDTVWTQSNPWLGDDAITNIEPYQDSMFVVSSNHFDANTATYFGYLRLIHENGNEIWHDTVEVDPAGSLFLEDFYIENDTLFAVGSYRVNDTSLFDLMRYIHYMPLNGAGEVLLSYGNSFRNIEGRCIAPIAGTPSKYISYTVENPIGGTLVINKKFVVGLSDYLLSIASVVGETSTEGDDVLFKGRATSDGGAVFVGYQTLENGEEVIAVAKMGSNYDHPDISGVTYVNQLVGMEDLFLEGAVLVFPNPSTSHVTVQVENSKVNAFELRDIHGKIVSSGALVLGNNSVSVSEVSPGMYLVQVKADGKIVGSKRLIVQ